MNSYLAAYPTTKENAVHTTTQLQHFGCKNTLKTTSSKQNENADTLNDSLSLILSPPEHEYYKRVRYSVGQQTEGLCHFNY